MSRVPADPFRPAPALRVRIELDAADGVRLRGLLLPGDATGPVFVIGHGFTNSTAKPSTMSVLRRFARHGSVIALDFRGHGGSGGYGSVGRDEVLDLDAAIGLARSDQLGNAGGDRPVVSVGFSMGASIALRQAAIGAARTDVVVSVSSPSRWYIRDTRPMRRVHWLLESPFGPLVGRFVGVRLGTPWPVIPTTPLELIDRIAPAPLLLVHGTADRYFPTEHAVALHRAARGHGELWIESGMGHAESGSSPDLIDRIAGWSAGAAGAR